ncbi:MAG: hypothetical protein ACOYKA_06520 [Legionellaceae bacterium]
MRTEIDRDARELFFSSNPESDYSIFAPTLRTEVSQLNPLLNKLTTALGYASGMVSAALMGVSGAGLVGLAFLLTPFQNLVFGLSFILIEEPGLYYTANFFLSAATALLSGFLGLAVVSLFTAALGNPFTLPMILASSASAALIFGVGVYVCQQFKTPEGMTNFLKDLFNPIATFFTGHVNDRFRDIKQMGEEQSFADRGISLQTAR